MSVIDVVFSFLFLYERIAIVGINRGGHSYMVVGFLFLPSPFHETLSCLLRALECVGCCCYYCMISMRRNSIDVS